MPRIFDNFKDTWDWYLSGAIPVSWTLKDSLFPRWLRFHSLPDSQRYPASEEDFAILLDRHNTLAAEVLGEGAECWRVTHLVVPDDPETEDWQADSRAELLAVGMTPVMRCRDDENSFDIYAGRVTWRRGAFDEVLRRIAQWQESGFWMSNIGTVFAPYDGGVDLILPDATHIVRLTLAYSDWLSRTREGY